MDEQFYGTTPFTGKFISGRYKLTIKKNGLLPVNQEVVVASGIMVPVTTELKRDLGSLGTTEKSKEKIQVALLNFSGSKRFSNEEIAIFTDRFRDELHKTNTFDVLDVQRMKSILDYIGFNLENCTKADCIIEAGKILNVDKMIAGSIRIVEKTYSLKVAMIDLKSKKIDHTIN